MFLQIWNISDSDLAFQNVAEMPNVSEILKWNPIWTISKIYSHSIIIYCVKIWKSFISRNFLQSLSFNLFILIYMFFLNLFINIDKINKRNLYKFKDNNKPIFSVTGVEISFSTVTWISSSLWITVESGSFGFSIINCSFWWWLSVAVAESFSVSITTVLPIKKET